MTKPISEKAWELYDLAITVQEARRPKTVQGLRKLLRGNPEYDACRAELTGLEIARTLQGAFVETNQANSDPETPRCPCCGNPLDAETIAAVMAMAAAKGGTKSRRTITPEQQEKMQEARKRKRERGE